MSKFYQNHNPIYVFKYVIVGDRNVGKSCITQRFVYNDIVTNLYFLQQTIFITQTMYKRNVEC